MKRSTKTILIVGVITAAVIGFLAVASSLLTTAKKVGDSEFFEYAGAKWTSENVLEYVKSNADYPIDKIIIDGNTLRGYTKSVSGTYVQKYYAYYTNISIWEEEIRLLKGNGVVFETTDPNSGAFFSSTVIPILMIGIALLAIFFLMRSVSNNNKGAIDFGKTKARVNQNVKVRFTDVAGAEEEKEELKELVDFLKDPKKFSALGAKIPRGVLLVGPPGTGKTLFAKAVAGEANVPFFSISGSDFVEMFVGVGASRVRDLFAMAKKSMPCIVFIDEIDAVGRQRGAGLGGGNDEREQTLNQLLVQMDGFDTNDGIIIMAATNRADILDPALMRPGRFDRQIYVNMPDVRGREAILKVHSRNKPLAADINFKTLARMTAGFSGADLANLLNEAAILAARKNEKAITNIDLYEAINKVLLGPQKKSRVVTEEDKRITAYHEAGHAILARLLPNCDPVQEVSIIPRGMAAGYTMTRPDDDSNHLRKNKLLDDIVMTLGGRVAEELIIGDISAGASNDISVVTERARKMVAEWGMSDKIGPVNYGGNEQVFIGRDMQTRSNYSESIATAIDDEVEKIVKAAHEKATKLLSENKELLHNMARLLIESETIYQDEVDLIMEGKSVKEIQEYMESKENERKENPFKRSERKAEEKKEGENKAEFGEALIENQEKKDGSDTGTF
ncbi:MAG: ATP-dependent zinc metalloprotease FtsH [Clostridia bacterium]|nr:ATP-dependent zinc metalloprotease FtsH [Clostridia bacterium]